MPYTKQTITTTTSSSSSSSCRQEVVSTIPRQHNHHLRSLNNNSNNNNNNNDNNNFTTKDNLLLLLPPQSFELNQHLHHCLKFPQQPPSPQQFKTTKNHHHQSSLRRLASSQSVINNNNITSLKTIITPCHHHLHHSIPIQKNRTFNNSEINISQCNNNNRGNIILHSSLGLKSTKNKLRHNCTSAVQKMMPLGIRKSQRLMLARSNKNTNNNSLRTNIKLSTQIKSLNKNISSSSSSSKWLSSPKIVVSHKNSSLSKLPKTSKAKTDPSINNINNNNKPFTRNSLRTCKSSKLHCGVAVLATSSVDSTRKTTSKNILLMSEKKNLVLGNNGDSPLIKSNFKILPQDHKRKNSGSSNTISGFFNLPDLSSYSSSRKTSLSSAALLLSPIPYSIAATPPPPPPPSPHMLSQFIPLNSQKQQQQLSQLTLQGFSSSPYFQNKIVNCFQNIEYTRKSDSDDSLIKKIDSKNSSTNIIFSKKKRSRGNTKRSNSSGSSLLKTKILLEETPETLKTKSDFLKSSIGNKLMSNNFVHQFRGNEIGRITRSVSRSLQAPTNNNNLGRIRSNKIQNEKNTAKCKKLSNSIRKNTFLSLNGTNVNFSNSFISSGRQDFLKKPSFSNNPINTSFYSNCTNSTLKNTIKKKKSSFIASTPVESWNNNNIFDLSPKNHSSSSSSSIITDEKSSPFNLEQTSSNFDFFDPCKNINNNPHTPPPPSQTNNIDSSSTIPTILAEPKEKSQINLDDYYIPSAKTLKKESTPTKTNADRFVSSFSCEKESTRFLLSLPGHVDSPTSTHCVGISSKKPRGLSSVNCGTSYNNENLFQRLLESELMPLRSNNELDTRVLRLTEPIKKNNQLFLSPKDDNNISPTNNNISSSSSSASSIFSLGISPRSCTSSVPPMFNASPDDSKTAQDSLPSSPCRNKSLFGCFGRHNYQPARNSLVAASSTPNQYLKNQMRNIPNISRFSGRGNIFNHASLEKNTIKLLSSVSQSESRRIPETPYYVKLIPELQDDFYLSLLDWGKNNTIAIGVQQNVLLWNPDTQTTKKLFCGIESEDDGQQISAVCWDPQYSNRIAVGRENGRLEVWDVNKMSKIGELFGHFAKIGTLTWQAGQLFSGSQDWTTRQWDVRTLNRVRIIEKRDSEICGVKLDISGEILATGGNDNIIKIWDARSDKAIYTYCEHSGAVKALSWSPKQRGLLASGGGTADRTIRFWDTRTINNTNSVGHIITDSQVCNIAWSPCGNELVSSHGFNPYLGNNNNTTTNIDINSGLIINDQNPHTVASLSDSGYHHHHHSSSRSTINSNNINNNNYNTIMNGNNNSTRNDRGGASNHLELWRYPGLQSVARLCGHKSRVLYMSVSPDGASVCTGAGEEDGSVKLWNVFQPRKRNKEQPDLRRSSFLCSSFFENGSKDSSSSSSSSYEYTSSSSGGG